MHLPSNLSLNGNNYLSKLLYGGDPPKLKLSSGGWAPGSTGFSHPGEHSRNPPVSCDSWCCCERLYSASVNFSEDSQRVCAFPDEWLTSAPAHTVLTVQQFLTKNTRNPMLHPPYFTQSHPSRVFFFFFFVFSMKKVLKGKYFADVEEVKQ